MYLASRVPCLIWGVIEPQSLSEINADSRSSSAGADSLLPIALAIQDRVRWQVDTGINDSVEEDMESFNWVPTPEQIKKWGVNRGGDFVLREAKKRRWRAYLANNPPLPRRWHPQDSHRDYDAANEQLFHEALLENENAIP